MGLRKEQNDLANFVMNILSDRKTDREKVGDRDSFISSGSYYRKGERKRWNIKSWQNDPTVVMVNANNPEETIRFSVFSKFADEFKNKNLIVYGGDDEDSSNK